MRGMLNAVVLVVLGAWSGVALHHTTSSEGYGNTPSVQESANEKHTLEEYYRRSHNIGLSSSRISNRGDDNLNGNGNGNGNDEQYSNARRNSIVAHRSNKGNQHTTEEEAHAPSGKHFTWKSGWQQGKKVTVLSILPEPMRDRRSVLRRLSTDGHVTRHGNSKHNKHHNKHRKNTHSRLTEDARVDHKNGDGNNNNNNEEIGSSSKSNIYKIMGMDGYKQSSYPNSRELSNEAKGTADNKKQVASNNNNGEKKYGVKHQRKLNKKVQANDEKEVGEFIGRARRDDGSRSVEKSERIRRRRERRRSRHERRRQRRKQKRRGRRRHNNTEGGTIDSVIDLSEEHQRERDRSDTPRNRAKSGKRKQRIENRRRKRRERRERRKLERKLGRSFDIDGLHQENKALLQGISACQYRDLRECVRKLELSPGQTPVDTIPRCMQRKKFLSCMELQRSTRGDCNPEVKAIGDLQALRKYIRSAMFTNSSCIIAESITG